MKIILANPRGFCAGVERAIQIVYKALNQYSAPIYVKHEIVHNKHVIQDLTEKGVIFVQNINEVPLGEVVIFSAHGVSQQVEIEARSRSLVTIDATCPLVKKIHYQVQRNENEGRRVIMIGHHGHPEVEGTVGRSLKDMILVENASGNLKHVKGR